MLMTRRRLPLLLLALLCGLATSVIVTATPATARTCIKEEAVPGGGVKCVLWDDTFVPGGPGDGGGDNGSSTPPPCDLDDLVGEGYKNPSAPFCKGTTTCQVVDHFAPLLMPEGDKPNEDSVARVEVCREGFAVRPGTPFWSDDEQPPSLLEQAQTAVGMLDFTAPTVGVSPAGRTLVNLDTWFWLDGAQTEVTASAFTLVVTARLNSITVNPGDGSPAFRCDPIPTSAAQAEATCVHEYRKASVRGSASASGKPAYAATVSSVYELTYTNGGNVIDIPGAQATIDGTPGTAAVRVDEAQAVVRPSR